MMNSLVKGILRPLFDWLAYSKLVLPANDALGRLVVPGLIDIHIHTSRTKEGPGLVLSDGVTGWIDAGPQGAD